MGGGIDLHIHSEKSSDGELSPFNIIDLAKKKGLKAISIADHDTVDSYPEALHFGQEAGLEIIPSLELTTVFDKREFHLLFPFVDWASRFVADLVDTVSEKRREEARERVSKLQVLGFDISWEDVLEQAGPYPPLGVTIASVLLKKKEGSDDPAFRKYFDGNNRLFAPYLFYKDFFMDGKPAAVPRRNIDLLDVLDTSHKTRGTPVLAHPGAYFQRTKQKDLKTLKERGLIGLEVFTPYHDAALTEFYTSMAEELDLVPTAGSDFHGKIKPHIVLGSLEDGGYWMVEELRKRRP